MTDFRVGEYSIGFSKGPIELDREQHRYQRPIELEDTTLGQLTSNDH